jgi:hypothetical protein
MDWFWNWGGECFGYRDGDSLFSYFGKEFGRFDGEEIYGSNGRCLGEGESRAVRMRAMQITLATRSMPDSRIFRARTISGTGTQAYRDLMANLL